MTGGRGDDAARARHARLMERFDALCDLGTDERGLELARLRDRAPDEARDVERLLRLDRDAAGSKALSEGLALLARDALGDESILDRGEAKGEPRRLLGQSIAGRYTVEEWIGGGGHGDVYRARGAVGPVALKVCRRDIGDERAARRFQREFQAISRLNHPGCLQVLEEGQHEQARYIVMELVEGGDLDRLRGAPAPVLLPVLVQVCEALHHVHGLGIVHRDLKPSNVLLVPGDPPRPRIADFGIAWQTSVHSPSPTSRGRLVGTIDYLSPEQVDGEPAEARSDLYAVGCMIHRLVAGRVPFEGSAFERLTARLDRPAPDLAVVAPHAPAALAALTSRLLARRPADRPESAGAVAAALASIRL